jgi:hypothetical protein
MGLLANAAKGATLKTILDALKVKSVDYPTYTSVRE